MKPLLSLNKQSTDPRLALEKQLGAITDELIRNGQQIRDYGLLDGKAGITLLFAYLTKAYPENEVYEDITCGYLEELSRALSEEELPHTMSSGITGIAFVFQHLRNMGLIDSSEDQNLAALDDAISTYAEQLFKAGNWDPLHGLIGLGIYFIERNKETGEQKYLERIVDQLNELSRSENGKKVWITPGYKDFTKDNYNFGIAHGMPGVLSFLAQVYALGIRKEAIKELIESCLAYLLPYRNENNESHYSFPRCIELGHDEGKSPKVLPSRHAWCYGDLSMANTLMHCGDALNREDWKELGIDIALKSTAIPFEYSGCDDAPLCHGVFGLAHQYHRLYRVAPRQQFKDATDYWLKVATDKYFRPDTYPGGYGYNRYVESERKFVLGASYGLLEGIAGIGLINLSFITGIEPGWDAIFQTNLG